MSNNYLGFTNCFFDKDEDISTETIEGTPEIDKDNKEQDLSEQYLNRNVTGFLEDFAEPMTSRGSNSKNRGVKSQTVMKNITKALLAFILSEMAPPYLDQIQRTDHENFEIPEYLEYIKIQREYVSQLKSLKSLFFSSCGENECEIVYKRVCRKIAIVFLKYFVVNWIFQSKLKNKEAYLKVRFKLLRKIQMVQ